MKEKKKTSSHANKLQKKKISYRKRFTQYLIIVLEKFTCTLFPAAVTM